jgi:SEC-C motif-containing protein
VRRRGSRSEANDGISGAVGDPASAGGAREAAGSSGVLIGMMDDPSLGAVPLPSQTAAVTGRRCPCGTGLTYEECCGPRHDGTTPPATAEQLMRSRYSAFAVGDAGYLLATWHATTRPAVLELDDGVRWVGLDVLDAVGGSLFDAEGAVEFRAHHVRDRARGSQHERSRFVREAGRWWYVDGVALP